MLQLIHITTDALWKLGRSGAVLVAGGLSLLLAGCMQGPKLIDQARLGPFYTPRNYAGEVLLPASVHRVLVLPVYAGTIAPPETAITLDTVVVTALHKQMRFEVVSITREEAQRRLGASEFSSVAALPHGFLELLRDYYGCEAILFIDLIAYQPYYPQVIGFRSKLAIVKDMHLLWNFDEVFSAANPAVMNSVRRFYYHDDSRANVPVDFSSTALQSPSRFAAYAADAMFKTLPPR